MCDKMAPFLRFLFRGCGLHLKPGGTRKGGTAMETLMNGAMVVEGALLSFLVALGMTWLTLNGLFRLMPAANRISQPIRFEGNRQEGIRGRHAA
jgi:hypothetical protein